MLFEQIITNNPSLQPYEYIRTEIIEDRKRLVLYLVLCQAKTEKNFIVFPEKFQISGLLPKKTLLSA